MLILNFFRDNIIIMVLFLLILLPCVLGLYFFQVANCKKSLVAFAGLFSAVVYCTAAGLFSSAFRLVPDAFFSNFIYYFLKETFIPLVLLYGIFFVWSKDILEYKIDSFFPLVLAFYSVFLPFSIMFGVIEFNFFQLFIKPLIFLFMIMSSFTVVKIFYRILQKELKNKYVYIILLSLAFLIILVLPAIVDALFITTDNYFLVTVIMVVFGGIQILLDFLFRAKKTICLFNK